MLREIAASGRPVGLKPSGGIRTLADAALYLALADEIMGPGWAGPRTFRFGASGLLDVLLATLDGADLEVHHRCAPGGARGRRRASPLGGQEHVEHVAERHDADHPSRVPDRHVPHAGIEHEFGGVRNAVAGVGPHQLGGHHVGGLGVVERLSHRNGLDHVALGDQAQRAVVVDHQDAADLVCGELPRHVPQ